MGTLADTADVRRDGYFIQPSKKFQRLQGADKPALTSSKAGEVRASLVPGAEEERLVHITDVLPVN